MQTLHPNSTKLYCFYDFAVCPASYDFFAFLYAAEICRIRRNLKSIEIILIKGPVQNFRGDSMRNKEINDTFLLNVIIPGLSILPSIESYLWVSRESLNISDINKMNIYPRGYQLGKPTAEYTLKELAAAKIRGDKPGFFRAPAFARKLVQDFIKNEIGMGPFITLTTREEGRSDHNTRRINTDMWVGIFKKLKDKGITPIIVRDTAKTFNKPIFEDIIEVSAASIHLPFRLALYEKALCNFTRNNGTANLKFFSRSVVRYFAEFSETKNFLSKKWWERNYGMTLGSQLPMTTTTSEIIWGPENSNYILETIKKLSGSNLSTELIHGFNSTENLQASINTSMRLFIANASFGLLEEDAKLLEGIVKWGVSDLKETLLTWQKEKIIPNNTIRILEKNYNLKL